MKEYLIEIDYPGQWKAYFKREMKKLEKEIYRKMKQLTGCECQEKLKQIC